MIRSLKLKMMMQLNQIVHEMEQRGGVFIPPNISKEFPVCFVIDNIVFCNNTPDGKSEFHGTSQVIFQKEVFKENNAHKQKI